MATIFPLVDLSHKSIVWFFKLIFPELVEPKICKSEAYWQIQLQIFTPHTYFWGKWNIQNLWKWIYTDFPIQTLLHLSSLHKEFWIWLFYYTLTNYPCTFYTADLSPFILEFGHPSTWNSFQKGSSLSSHPFKRQFKSISSFQNFQF